MGAWRGLGRGLGKALGALLLVPTLALVPAALVDRGPDGDVRRTLVYAGLAASDSFVWRAASNSLVVAATVSIGSMVVGIGLAQASARRRFWGRGPLAALSFAPMAVAPLFGALGLRALFGADRYGWGMFVWAEMACGVPVVAMAASGALRGIDPAWEDAARLAGAGRWRSWRDLCWPLMRPAVARAAGLVFALTLFEPGAPLVLGLRRTLAVQAVEAATREAPGSSQTAAVLALIALGLAAAGAATFRAWGRSAPTPSRAATTIPVDHASAAVPALLLATWSAVALLPAFGLLSAAIGPRLSAASFRALAGDGEALAIVAQSLVVGLVAGGLATLAASRRTSRTRPPLAVGIGALMIPGLLEMGADWLASARPEGTAARFLRLAADALDPFRAPGVLLAWALAATHIPALAPDDDDDGAGRVRFRERSRRRRALIDVALSLGASPRRARRDASGLRRPSGTGRAWMLAAALAATDTAAALVLCPTSTARPVGPGVLLLAFDPDGMPRASALACLAIVLNLAAFAWFALGRRKRGPA